MKKWLSMFLATVMLCGVLAGCGGTQSGSTPASGAQSASAAGDSNVNAEGFPIVNEPITLRGMVALNANVKDWNEHPALKRMEELTGIHIEWECVPDAGFTEKRNLAFASDDLPDIILRAKISPQEEMKYAANGQLVALDEYLDYAPNLSALIEQDDAIRKGITMPDGHIYSCPQLNKTEGNLIHHYWINKTWLDNLGLEAPTTVDELYDVLVAFRDNDPNGNGQKDEIPYCVVGKDYPHRMFYDLLGSWGFGINGVMDSDYAFSWLDIDDAGNVRLFFREHRQVFGVQPCDTHDHRCDQRADGIYDDRAHGHPLPSDAGVFVCDGVYHGRQDGGDLPAGHPGVGRGAGAGGAQHDAAVQARVQKIRCIEQLCAGKHQRYACREVLCARGI